MSSHRLTIEDVARAAGVSKATVSRFLNRRDDLLTRDIAERVEAAINRLGYAPSPMAQSLKRGRSRIIGLIVADVANPFSVAVLRGAEKACRDAGYMVMLCNVGEEGREREAVRTLAGYRVEGFLLHPMGRDPAVIDDAQRHGKPVVMIDRRLGDAQGDLVALDNAGAVQAALRHLDAAGYRDLLLVTDPIAGFRSREQRAAAFRDYVAQHGEHLQGSMHEVSGPNAEAVLDTALRAIRDAAAGRPIAVVAGNSLCTLRVAGAARRLGWQLGSELGLVGIDDTDWAPLIGPGITTVAQPTDDIGRLAAHCLLERLSGSELPPREILLPGTLLVRGSSRRDA